MAESVGNKSGKTNKLTPEQRGSIIELSRAGYPIPDIAEQLGIPVKQVSGTVNTARNRGDLAKPPAPPPPAASSPPPPPAAPHFAPASALPEIPVSSVTSLPQEESMTQQPPPPASPVAPAPVAAAPVPVPLPAPPPYGGLPVPDGYSYRSALPGNGPGTFSYPQNQIRYVVTRLVPQDGILGTHAHPFEPVDCGKIYGSGTYTVTKQEPGRPPMTSEPFQIARSYGLPRFGNQESRTEERRPMISGRPFDRNGGDLSEEDPSALRVPPRPSYDPRLADFARTAPPPSPAEPVAAAAIAAMSRLQEQQQKDNMELRKNGPDNWLQQMMMSQQKNWEEQRERESARREEERRRDEERREEDRKREENRRTDEKHREEARLQEERRRDDARLSEERKRSEEKIKQDDLQHQRRMEEEDKKHTREIERLKMEGDTRARFEAEQRKTILDLEQKKIEIIQTEAKAREEMMKKELERNREDFNKVTSEMTTQMSDLEKGVTAQLDRERDQLRREFDIKNKALDNEHALRTEMLRLREETSSRGEGEAFTKMIEKIVTEVGKNVKEVVELKKMEVMSPEAQAAHVSKATDGNVQMRSLTTPPPAPSQRTPTVEEETPEAETEEAHAPAQSSMSGLPGAEGGKVDELVRDQLKGGVAQQLLKEWVMHVGAQSPPQMFVNMFVQYMRTDDEKQAQACTTFATYITPRPWAVMFPVLKPVLTPDQLKVLETEYAEEFYEAFRALAVEAVREYWEAFAIQRQQARAAQQPAVTKGASA